MLKKGDNVIMHDCGEAEHYEGVVWTCRSNESKLCGNKVIWLEGFSGAFAVKYLRKIDTTQVNTVICEGCDKEILADSKGYSVLLESEGPYCLECEKAKSEQLQAQVYVHNSMNETKQTHVVFKTADVEGANISTVMNEVTKDVNRYRYSTGRTTFPNYIVINTDENPLMVKEIIEVMKRFDKWG